MRGREDAWRRDRVDGRWMCARAWNEAARATRLPVVLVHGLVISSRYMVPLGAQLGRWLPAYAPDLPGFGRSSAPRDGAADVDGLADALARWMDAVDLPRASVLGNSLGCQVAVALAQRHPARVDRLVLVGPTVDAGARTWHAQALRLLADAPRERWTLPLLEGADLVRAGPARAWRAARAALDDRIEARAPHVRAPVVVVRGDDDPLVPHEWARRLASAFPSADLLELPGPHAVHHRRPAATARALLPFLEAARALPATPPARATAGAAAPARA